MSSCRGAEVGRRSARRRGTGRRSAGRFSEPSAPQVAEGLGAHDGRGPLAGRPARRCSPESTPLQLRAQLRQRFGVRRTRRRGRPRRARSATASAKSATSSGSSQKCGSRSPWSWPLLGVLLLGLVVVVMRRPRSTAAGRRPRRRPRRVRHCSPRAASTAGWKPSSSTSRSASARAAVWAMLRSRSCGSLPGLCQVLHGPGVARHPLGHPCQRVERRDSPATASGLVVSQLSATGKEDGGGQEAGEG